MMTLAELRSFVRTHLDVTADDIPDLLLDQWANIAFIKITASRRRFPSNEVVVDLPLVANTSTYVNPMKRITNAYLNGVELERTHVSDILAQHSATNSVPNRYAVYGTNLYIYPTPTVAATLKLLGARNPIMTWRTSPSTPVDLPDIYEPCMVAWVLCEAYKHAQDIPMANNYAADFAILLQQANGNFIDTPDTFRGNSKGRDQW